MFHQQMKLRGGVATESSDDETRVVTKVTCTCREASRKFYDPVAFEKQGTLCYIFLVTPEENKKLEEVYELVKENNSMLKKVRRVQKNAMLIRVLYWFVIVAIALGAFYYIKPYMENLISVYTNTADTFNNLEQNIPDVGNINELLKQIQSN